MRFLFTGDMEREEEQEVLNEIPAKYLETDILKVAHHGSATSTSEDFLRGGGSGGSGDLLRKRKFLRTS